MVGSQPSSGLRRLRPLPGRAFRVTGEKPFDVHVINTDMGPDCDDAALVMLALQLGKPDDKFYFIVTGPHPDLAAKAIAQAAKTMNRQCEIALGTTYEQDKFPKENIFSLINDRPIAEQEVDLEPRPLADLHRMIDDDIKTGKVDTLQQIVVGPLHATNEFYDNTSRLESDPLLKRHWQNVQKIRVAQFRRTDQGEKGFAYETNNAEKSNKTALSAFTDSSVAKGHDTTYVEGEVAKFKELRVSTRQKERPGLEKYIHAYQETAQVPWAYLSGGNGVTPGPHEMHAGMFTPKGIFPYCVHVSGKSKNGFGLQRLASEVCDIAIGSQGFKEMAAKADRELDRFDGQVLSELKQKHPEFAHLDLNSLRQQMHEATLGALNEFAKSKGGLDEMFSDFKQFFDGEGGKKVKAYSYSDEFQETLFQSSPLVRAVTKIAAEQISYPRNDGKTHLNRMTEIFADYGATAVIYDAIALAAANAARRNPELRDHFKKRDGAINITSPKIGQLQKDKQELFREFISGTRDQIERIGLVFAKPFEREAPAAAKDAPDTALAAAGPTSLKRAHDASQDRSAHPNKRPHLAEPSIADRVMKRHRGPPRDDGLSL